MSIKEEFKPPFAAQRNHELIKHNDTRIDPYYWLNNREDKQVINYLNEENKYTKQAMAPLEDFQELLFQEIKGRIKETDMSVPFFKNGYYYYNRFEEGKEYSINCRKKTDLNQNEEIILDENIEAKGHAYFATGGMSISPDNKLMVYGEDIVSRRIYSLKVKDLTTNEMLTDVIPNTTGSGVWANDNKTVFYTVKDEALRPYKIYKHVLGTDPSEDELVYHEEDPKFISYISKSKSGKYLIIASYSTDSTEFRILNANNPTDNFTLFNKREEKHEYNIYHYADKFYIRTNLDAENFKLVSCNCEDTDSSNWEDVIPHRPDVLLEDINLFTDFLVISERVKGITQIRIKPFDGIEHTIEWPEDAFLAYTSVNYEFDTNIIRVGYQSMTTPNSIIDYNMESRERVLLKQQEVIGNFKSADYTSERRMAEAQDGTLIPISIVYKTELKTEGNNPCLLYAYGSYGYSMEPYFSSVRLSLLDRGFIYAIAHIRGGEEMGRHWYNNGKLLNKKNTFTDFIDCGNFLVESELTAADKLYAMGGSAGGLLMGAIINMAPKMWAGIVAAVPFVDVLTTMLDETIPLTAGEYPEWGNPNEETYYWYIKSYSPYDNVEAKEYPPMLVTTGLHDSQVQYWEPAKWVAKLRTTKTDNNILLLRTNMETGHGGASGRFAKYKETAMEYAFLLDLAGVR